jgi:photosystem I subunit 11
MAKLVTTYENDPFVGHLSTPITTSILTRVILKNLPIYRAGLSSILRGIEIGMAHGYFLIGPFVTLGPLRNSEIANFAGLLSTFGLIIILAMALSMYGTVSFETSEEGSPIQNKIEWKKFTLGFTIGGFGGAGFAFGLINNFL